MSTENKVIKQNKLTPFGKYLAVRSVNKSDVARKVGISLTRLNRLCYDEKSFLRAYELQLIALAINVEPEKMQKELYGHLKLKEEFTPSEKIINRISKSLNEKDLLKKYSITIRELERVTEILLYCNEERNELEILKKIGLKRRSPKIIRSLKASIEIGWLTLRQQSAEGNLISIYKTSEAGKEILQLK
ncbi:helix-turn-helix domain-containing protein [Sphingobacterium sp. LRF_L2]|uniref:helix-turn-helix domain-containing protein n=1 Tax=Sphingobacterium sp. LRF_L2 TaxID=3369421 RepID=UPI003F60681B